MSLNSLSNQSRVTNRQMIGIGAGLAVAGGAGLAFFAKATSTAIEYNRQAALTLTQTQGLGITLKQVEQVGIDVAKGISAPFDQMQESLYDIFSSMDIGRGAQAIKNSKTLLADFSKAAVAGQVDLQTAARATIAIMNAYELEANDVRKVNDFMFQLVAKGVGTYDEFAKAIGRSIPSARRAGQTYQTLGGVMAFLTRNGQSAAMAATSAGRAMDSLTKGPVGERLDAMGISIRTTTGEFRQINDVATDLGKHFRNLNLTGPQVAATMEAIFKGAGGTIQARRFWDLAVKNFEQLNSLTKDVTQNTGALAKAYDTMAATPAQRIQALKNAWEIFNVEIGRVFIPIAMTAMDWLQQMLGAFQALPEPIQKTAIALLAVTFAAAAIGGTVMILTALVKMSGGMRLLSASFGILKDAINGLLLRLSYLTGTDGLLSISKIAPTVIRSLGLIGLAVGAVMAIQKIRNDAAKRRDKAIENIIGRPEDLQDLGNRLAMIRDRIHELRSKGGLVNNFLADQYIKAGARGIEQAVHYAEVVGRVTSATQASEKAVLSHANALGLNLFDAAADADFQVSKLNKSIGSYRVEAALAGDTSVELADKLAIASEGLAKWLKSDEGKKDFSKFIEDSKKGIKELSDVIAKYGKDADVTNGKLKTFYKEQQEAVEKWNKNLLTALRKGMDPNLIKEFATKGPIEAGVLLDKIVNESSGAMLKTVNEGNKNLQNAGAVTDRILQAIYNAQVLGNQGMLNEAREAGQILEMILGNTGGEAAVKFVRNFDGGMQRFQAVADAFGIDWATWFNSLPKEIQMQLSPEPITTQKTKFSSLFIEWFNNLPRDIKMTLDSKQPLTEIQKIRKAMVELVNFVAGSPVTASGTPRAKQGQANTPAGLFEASGGLVFFAKGGLHKHESHIAQIAKPGAWRVWAEDETGGEAYIPLALSKRRRSIEILGRVARHFGLAIGDYAEGGVSVPMTRAAKEIEEWGKKAHAAAKKAMGSGLVGVARMLQKLFGVRISEHPAFGGVRGRHVPGSYHYRGRAIDVNYGSGGVKEMGVLDRVAGWIRRNVRPIQELLWRVKGHFNHLHLAMGNGGILRRRTGGRTLADMAALVGERGPELLLPPQQGRHVISATKLERLMETAEGPKALVDHMEIVINESNNPDLTRQAIEEALRRVERRIDARGY